VAFFFGTQCIYTTAAAAVLTKIDNWRCQLEAHFLYKAPECRMLYTVDAVIMTSSADHRQLQIVPLAQQKFSRQQISIALTSTACG